MSGVVEVPAKLSSIGLSDWFATLTDQDRVRLRRYTDNADGKDAAAFVTSIILAAVADSNYKFAAKVADTTADMVSGAVRVFDFNEASVLAYYNTERYDDCLARCDYGLSMLKDSEVRSHVVLADGSFPESVNCRNYKINVIVGIRRQYDEAGAVLDQFVADGLITADEARMRKDSIRTFRLQRTFEGIFAGRRAQ